jgi:hypothetical protein
MEQKSSELHWRSLAGRSCYGEGTEDGEAIAGTERSWVRIPLRHGCFVCVLCAYYI